MDNSNATDLCRVCRSEGLPERPLFHPCVCTGSIKWIHQECLMQWMRYSRKEYCELCSHRFSFTPIYSPDMPRRLPLKDVVGGLLSSIITAIKYWLHYSLVAISWLGIVPLTACRIYRCLFSGSIESIITLPLDILTTQNIPSDVFHGCFVITCTLFAFMGMVWLQVQILQGDGPDWLVRDLPQQQAPQEQPIQGNQQNAAQPDNPLEVQIVADNTNSNFNNNNNNSSSNTNSGGNSNINSSKNYDNSDNDEDDNVNCNNSSSSSSSSSSNSNNNDDDDDNDKNSSSSSSSNNSDSTGNNSSGSNKNNNNNNYNHNNNMNNTSNNNFIRSNNNPGNNDYQKNDNIKNNDGDDDHYHEHDTDADIQAQPIEVFQDPLGEPQENDPNERDELQPIQLNPDPIEAREAEAAENAQDEGNWNPIEWDRAAEELTLERLLGLDGSLVFLKNVFWVVSLNTLLIAVFAFLPYHFGNFALTGLGFRDKTIGTHFEGLITTLCGYCIIGFCLVILHSIATFLNFQRSRRILGLCCVTVKVFLLSVMEIGVLPLICGWWLDICSLAMFDATLKDRETSFKLAPGTSMFIHWLFGIIYVYYFASFILLLREVLRPGVLWFLINLNDPDFGPIQKLIHLPVVHHVQRLIVTSVVFGTVVLLTLWLPIKIIRAIWPSFLPYRVVLQSETQVNELSLEFLLLQIILPALLEQSQSRTWMKSLIRLWCKSISWLLGIHSYLLGDEGIENTNSGRGENAENDREDFNGLNRNRALLPQDDPIEIQPYQSPTWFYARLFGLILALFVSLIIASLIVLSLPVWFGRRVIALWVEMIRVWLVGASAPSPPLTAPSVFVVGEDIPTRIYELFTVAFAAYPCWIIVRAVTLLKSWLSQGRAAIFEKLKQWCVLGLKSLVAFSILLGIIPLLFGLLLELVILVPLRVPLEQSPVLFIWQDWALGVLYTKIACAVIMMGPNWSMRRAIERIYRDGIRNMDLSFILYDITMPVVTSFGLALAIPYATAHGVIPLLITNIQLKNLIVRRLYPYLLIALFGVAVVIFQVKQFKKLYDHIKNDKYLVGKRLVNYDHKKSNKPISTVQ